MTGAAAAAVKICREGAVAAAAGGGPAMMAGAGQIADGGHLDEDALLFD